MHRNKLYRRERGAYICVLLDNFWSPTLIVHSTHQKKVSSSAKHPQVCVCMIKTLILGINNKLVIITFRTSVISLVATYSLAHVKFDNW